MQIPPGFIAVFARYTNVQGHPCQNVVGYEVTDPPNQDFADYVSNTLADPYRAQLSSSGFWLGVHILIGSDGEPGAIDSDSGAGAGSRTGDIAAPQVQGLIRKTTALGGRKNRGRMYIADMSEAQVQNGGSINGGGITLLQDIADAWFTTVPVGEPQGPISPVVLHNSSLAPTEITAMSAQATVATLRKRYTRS